MRCERRREDRGESIRSTLASIHPRILLDKATMATPVALSSCLLIDPTVEPEPFNAAELIERFEQGKRDDDREMEGEHTSQSY
jgi:hypothetical protein